MKELFNILSNVSDFWNEKRFVFAGAETVTYKVTNPNELQAAFAEISCNPKKDWEINYEASKGYGNRYFRNKMQAFKKNKPKCEVNQKEEEKDQAQKEVVMILIFIQN